MMFLTQMRGELRKMFARRRSYIGYAVFLGFELIFLWLWMRVIRGKLEELAERNLLPAEQLYSSLTATYWIMSWSMFLLGSIFFALVSGDIVAKEAEDGNLRLVLARPVSRFRLLLLKYLAVMAYTVSFVIFVGITGYGISVIAMGPGGGLFVWNPEMSIMAVYAEWNEGFWRLFVAAVFMGLSMCTVSALGFFFSCLPMKPAAATIMALSVFFVDFVLKNIPYLADYRENFVTHRMSCWVYLLQNDIPWARVTEDYVFLAGVNLSLFIVGWMVFQARDFKS